MDMTELDLKKINDSCRRGVRDGVVIGTLVALLAIGAAAGAWWIFSGAGQQQAQQQVGP